MREDADIAVIGAGPSGLIAAREASKEGANVMILEEHSEIGEPCHCAGLLSINGLNRIGASNAKSYTLNMIRGMRLFSPSKIPIEIEWKKPIACVVDRRLFDMSLAKQAWGRGSLIKLKSRVVQAIKENGGWLLRTESGDEIKAKIVIDAEGALPKIPRIIGIKTHDPKKLLKGVQVDIPSPDIDPDYIEVHFSRSLAPGLFAWVIPLNGEIVRVGLACNASSVRERLIKFIKKRFNRSIKGFLKYYSGIVITCGPIKRTYGDGILIVGDSAGHTKPITGGGVIFGGTCASIAGKIASIAVKRDTTGSNFLRVYEDEWKARMGNELRIALLIRKIFNSLRDKDMDKAFLMALREEIHKKIVSEGAELDYQATTLMRALKWRLLKFAPIILGGFISNLIEEKQQIYKWGAHSSTN